MIYVDLPQIYEGEPGKPLGRYTIRRILKTDGSKKHTAALVARSSRGVGRAVGRSALSAGDDLQHSHVQLRSSA
jgi:hypothetical protein